MKNIILLIFCAAVLFGGSYGFAAQTTIVLQNGLNQYNGCSDVTIANEICKSYLDIGDTIATDSFFVNSHPYNAAYNFKC